MRINIIGAGVAGLSVATELAGHAHLDLSVYDRANGLGDNACSWWAGGMLAPWCEGESAEEPVVRLGAKAADWWEKHANCVTRNGSMVVALARDRGELKRFARRTSHFETLDGAQLAELEPELDGRFHSALYFPEEAHLNPREATATLLAGLTSRGVAVNFGVDAREVNPDQADLTIDCRGLAARDELADLRGVKGEMLILRCPGMQLHRPIRLLHPRMPLYIVPRADNLFMVGATMIESSDRKRISARSMLELLGAAYALHSAFGEAEVVEIGVDARPAFSDNLPRVRRDKQTIYANGLFRHGFLLAPALAQMVAELALNPDASPEFLR
jgi:glycine oxidase